MRPYIDGHFLGCPAGESPTGLCTCPKPEMTSLVEIKSRLAAIEQRITETKSAVIVVDEGQAIICERLDARNEMLDGMARDMKLIFEILTGLAANFENFAAVQDAIANKLRKPKPKRRAKP